MFLLCAKYVPRGHVGPKCFLLKVLLLLERVWFICHFGRLGLFEVIRGSEVLSIRQLYFN